MKSRIILKIGFFLLSIILYAQNANVQLKVIDDYGIPVAYALVEIYDETDQLVNGGVTDENGLSKVNKIPFGDYRLHIEMATFEDLNEQIKINQKEQDLGTYEIKLKSELDEVVVRSENSKYTIDIDKRVVEVGKDLVSSGASAADVLNNIPSVSIDQQSGELTLRGNSNVRVMVDGKPSNIPTAQLLKQLPSNSIKSVEIITNPSAKYDPDGNSGILNIITNKEKRKGYNVALNTGLTTGQRTRENASINTNFNTGKFNLFANYSGNWGKNYFYGNINTKDPDIDQNMGIESNSPNGLVKFGFDYFIDDQTALTIYTNQNFSKSTGNWDYFFYENQGTFENNNDETGKYGNGDYSLNFKRNLGREDQYFEIDGIYSSSKNNSDRGYLTNYPLNSVNPQNYNELRDRKDTNARLNFDYYNVIKEKTTLEAGFQYRREGIKNDFNSGQEIPNPQDPSQVYSPDVRFDFTRNIYSSYFNLKRKFGKWGTQIGLRYENVEEQSDNYYNTFTENDIYAPYKSTYNQLYPSAFLTYTLGEKNTFSLNYSRRVDRPSVFQLSPVSEWNTGLIRSVGNPDLKPQFTNSVELGYLRNIKIGSVSANLFYRKITDDISRLILVDPDVPNGAILKYVNYNTSDAYGVETNFYLKINKWWNLNGGLDLFSNQVTYGDLRRRSTPFNARISQDFKLLKVINLQYFFMYRGKNVLAQGEMQPMWKMDLGARYNFAKDRASITMRVNDIFKTFFAEVHVDQPYNSVGQFHWEAHTFYVGLSYNFGGKVKTRADKQQNRNTNQGGGVGF